MSKCCYPGCWLEEHEEGEHKIGRPPEPWGELRLIHQFSWARAFTSCDLDPGGRVHTPATDFFADMLGFGWALCIGCQRKYKAPLDKPSVTTLDVSPAAVTLAAAGETTIPAVRCRVVQTRKRRS